MQLLMNPPEATAAPEDPRAPQQGDPDRETFETIVAGLREYIFGNGAKVIVKQLQDGADNIGETIGQMVYGLVKSAADQASESGRETGLDILLGVATQIIDDLIDTANSVGIEATQEDAGKEALLVAVQSYMAMSNPSEEERAVAQQMLQQMADEGGIDEATATLQEMGQRRGIDPFAKVAQS